MLTARQFSLASALMHRFLARTCGVLLLFSMVIATDTGYKNFDGAFVSVLKNYSGPLEIGNY